MMTDNEIINALECCTNNGYSCKDCPYEFSHSERKWCDEVLMEDAFALITRQKAEIERLRTSNDALRMSIELCKGWEERAKAEAVKEFEENAQQMITEIYNRHIFGSNDLNDEEKDAVINFSDEVTSALEGLVKKWWVMCDETVYRENKKQL